MDFTERYFTDNRVALSIWILPDGATSLVARVPYADYETWRQTPGKTIEQCPGYPGEGSRLVLSTWNQALDTTDGWPHTGDTWYENGKQWYQVGEDHDWFYRRVTDHALTETTARRVVHSWVSTGNRSTDPNSIPSYTHIADEQVIDVHHSIAFQSSTAFGSAGSTNTINTSAVDVLAGTNLAMVIGLAFGDTGGTMPSGETVVFNGDSATIATGTDATFFSRSVMYGLLNPDVGTGLTLDIDWTTNGYATAEILIATGVASFNNGTNSGAFNAEEGSVTITSPADDMSVSSIANAAGLEPFATNQSLGSKGANASQIGCGIDYKTTLSGVDPTHTWDMVNGAGTGYGIVSGLNMVAASAGPTVTHFGTMFSMFPKTR